MKMTEEEAKKRAAERKKKWREDNPGYNALYRAAHLAEDLARSAAWRLANREKATAYSSAYYAAHKDKANINRAAWRARNPQKAKVHRENYWTAHPDAQRIYAQERRAKKAQSGGKLSPDIVAKLLSFQKNRCAICRVSLKKSGHHLDHIIPLVPRNGDAPGKHQDSNMQLTCPECNVKKSNKDPIEYMQSCGYLL